MNCFGVPKRISSPRRKIILPSTGEQNIPTILESSDTGGEHPRKVQEDCVFDDSTSSSISQSDGSIRRLSFRLGSDAEESCHSSNSQRTTPSFSGHLVFDFEHSSLSRSSSTSSTPPLKLLSNQSTGAPATMFLELPRDPFQPNGGPMIITNSHSSDRLASAGSNIHRLSPGNPPTLQLSRSCNTLTKGIFGNGKGAACPPKDRSSIKWRRRSSNTDPEDTSNGKHTDSSRKSSDSDNTSSEQSIFVRFIHRWQAHQEAETTVPPHALFLKHNPTKQNITKPSRSHSETEAVVEVSVKHRLRDLVRRNTESVLKHKPAAKKDKTPSTTKRNKSSLSNRPPPEEAASWADSFDNLLANTYGTALFRAFLQLEYNEENLAFYLACEKFKRLDASGQRKLAIKAQKIYDEFVRVEAPREVNMDSSTRSATTNNLANPNRYCFDSAQRFVRHVLEKDVYPRFLKFELYTQLLGTKPQTAI